MGDNRMAMQNRKPPRKIPLRMRGPSVALLTAEGENGKRVVPTEFKVFPAGPFQTTKGIFSFTAKSAADVMTAYTSRNLPLMGDYEHQTDAESMGLPPMEARASITEMTPEVRMNDAGQPELWVKDVHWTDRAREYLEAGEYRLFSPVFGHTPEGEITSLIRIALTNKPATDGLLPLVAATETEEKEERQMIETCAACATKDQEIGKLTAQLTALSTEKEALTARLKDFGQWADEEEKEHEQLTALTGKKDKLEILAVLTAQKSQADQFVALKAQVDAEKLTALTASYNAKADEAIKAGTLPPATKTACDEIAKTDGIAKAFTFLSTFVDANKGKPLVTTLTDAGKEPGAVIGLTEQQKKIAEMSAGRFGGNPVDLAKALNR